FSIKFKNRTSTQHVFSSATRVLTFAFSITPDRVTPKFDDSERYDFEIVDESRVPREFMTPNNKALLKFVTRYGLETNIPGIQVIERLKREGAVMNSRKIQGFPGATPDANPDANPRKEFSSLSHPDGETLHD